MGRLPPLPKKANGVNETSTSWTAEYDYDYSDYSGIA